MLKNEKDLDLNMTLGSSVIIVCRVGAAFD